MQKTDAKAEARAGAADSASIPGRIRVGERIERSLAKSLSYRLFTSFVVTPSITFCVTGEWKYAAMVGLGELALKIPGYALFEQAASRVPFGYRILSAKTASLYKLKRGEHVATKVPEHLLRWLRSDAGLAESDKVVVIETRTRSLAKAFAYRTYASLIETPLVALTVTHQPKVAFQIGATEFPIKILTYWAFERVWTRLGWGYRASPGPAAGAFGDANQRTKT